jgi:DnaD/phage-associated family protein
MPFKGFPSGKVRFTPIPGQFFSELLPEIDDLYELKLTLYALWRLERTEGRFRYLRCQDFLGDARFLAGLGAEPETALNAALTKAVQRGTLLPAQAETGAGNETFYLLNTPRGQAAVKAIQSGRWQPSGDPNYPLALDLERPNIYRLYEENIGPLTPLLAETLQEAEDTYPEEWIEEAIRIALENNARNWRYVEAILTAWKEGKGRYGKSVRRDTEKDRSKYRQAKFEDFIDN